MKSDREAYEHMFKRCPVCKRVTKHTIESTASECEVCHTLFDDDAEDLMGEIED